jgi:isopentenyldiphosphate isomerase
MNEEVDILKPPHFQPSGIIKSREQALKNGDWIGTFNLWVVRRTPEPAILYQQRSLQKSWAPGMLDLAAAGHYKAGEVLADGLREAEEELGVQYDPNAMTYLGKRLFVDHDTNGYQHNNAIHVFIIEDDAPLDAYTLQQEEVEAICILPIQELLKVHRDETYQFTANALTNKGENTAITVKKESFPYNFDNYHYKMAVLANRYFSGEEDLLY